LTTTLVTHAAPASAPCVINLCTEADGTTVAVYLTDTTCSANAADYLLSKCGVGYNATECIVDCNGEYSWYGSNSRGDERQMSSNRGVHIVLRANMSDS
jgi:hypothetical protein